MRLIDGQRGISLDYKTGNLYWQHKDTTGNEEQEEEEQTKTL